MHSKKINKTRYDDPGKLMKQNNFTEKNLEGKPSRKAIHNNKEKFQI